MAFVMNEILVLNSVEQFSYLAIFLFAISAGYIVPIPEEIVLLITGYMASAGYIHFTPALFVIILAFIIGDNVLYKLTLKNNKLVKKMIHEVLSLTIIAKNRKFLEKNISTTIFITRFIPFLRFIGPVFSGYVKVKEKTFMLFNTLAIVIYAPIMLCVGYFFHDDFTRIVSEMGRVRHIAVILGWVIIGLLITRLVDYFFKKDEEMNRE